MRTWFALRHLRPTLLLLAALTTAAGCGFLSNLLHDRSIPPKYAGLKKRKVAVVCITAGGVCGPSEVSNKLAKRIEHLLRVNVPKITIVDQGKITEWKREHDWSEGDYRMLGEGVEAEMVLAVEVPSYGVHDGQGLYRGQAEAEVQVFDLTGEDAQVVFQRQLPPLTFPKQGGYATTEYTKRQFESAFLERLAFHVARQFYYYSMADTLALDSPHLGP